MSKPEVGVNILGLEIPKPEKGVEFAGYPEVLMIDAPAKPSLYKNYVFSSRESALSGPFQNDFTAIASKPNSSELFAVDKHNDVYRTDTTDLNNTELEKPPADVWDLNLSFSPNRSRGIIANKKCQFLYRNKHITAPFEDVKPGHFDLHDPLYFRDAQLSIAETHWMHFGNEAYEKDVYRVDLTFHRNSFGQLWLYVQNDLGQVSGQYKGYIEENMKVFTNLRGRRFKIKMFVATHDLYPWAMREMAVGYNLGKSF
jgi:hypothetical protein